MKSNHYSSTNKIATPPRPQKNKSPHRPSFHEKGIMVETSLKLFFSLFVGLVATISLARLLPYHFAQSGKLKELRAQVKETEYRVKIKRQELEQNFDSWQAETLREEYSPRIAKNRFRVFWQNEKP